MNNDPVQGWYKGNNKNNIEENNPFLDLKMKPMKSRFGFLTWNPPWKHYWNPLWDFEIYCKIQISQLNPLFIDKCMVILRSRKKSIPPLPPMDDHWKSKGRGGSFPKGVKRSPRFKPPWGRGSWKNPWNGKSGAWGCKSKSLLWGVGGVWIFSGSTYFK